MCVQSSFYHQLWIDTGRSKFEQVTDSILLACWFYGQSHKDLKVIDLNVPRHAQYLHFAWKRHQDAVCWVDINLGIEQGLTLYQTRSNAIILHETLPVCCIPKVVRMETGEVIYEKVYASPLLPPKISLKHQWMKDLGSEVARQPDGEVVQQSKSSQSSQPNPNPDHDRTVKLVVCRDAKHEQSMLNEDDIDIKIPWLQHSAVKQAENYHVLSRRSRTTSPTISSSRSTTKQRGPRKWLTTWAT